MKRIICFLIAIIAVLSIIIPIVSAEDNVGYGEEELKTALRGAFEMYQLFFRYCADLDDNGLALEVVQISDKEYPSLYKKRCDKYENWDDFIAGLELYYSDEMKNEFLSHAPVYNHNGFTFVCEVLSHAQNEEVYLDMSLPHISASLDESFKIIYSDNKKIIAEFDVFHYSEDDVRTYTVEYQKNSSGWRVAGGSFFKKMIVETTEFDAVIPHSPKTGDGTIHLLCLAVASALLASRVKRRFSM